MAQRVRSDWFLFATVVAMALFSVLAVYSASSVVQALNVQHQDSLYYATRQLAWAALAIVAMLLVKRVNYRQIYGAAWAYPAFGIATALVFAAYLVGDRYHRSIRLAGVGIQPSELAKPALILFLAYFLTRKAGRLNEWRTLAPLGLALAVLAAAVMKADLGTGVVIVATAVAMVWVAGLENRYLAAGAALFVILGIFAVRVELYRFARVVGFFGPHSVAVKVIDPTGSLLAELAADERYRNELGLGHPRAGAGEAGAEAATPEEGKKARNYQLEQGRIALGSGGIMGLGLGGSIQKLFYLPEAHTDFIWAVVGEELGFLGTAGTWIVFGLILWRGLRLSFTVTDPFGRYLALGVTVLLVGQAFFNMSVVLGLLPTKGIPLPLVSYGGSSLLSSMLSMGLLLSVNDHAT